jgi:hypothetical protein
MGFACGNWTAPSHLRLVDYYVRDFANGVDRCNFPSGPDRGVLTQVIELVVDNLGTWAKLKLSHIEDFVEQLGVELKIVNPFPIPGMGNPDVEALHRHKQGLLQYRQTLKRYRLRQKEKQLEGATKGQAQADYERS